MNLSKRTDRWLQWGINFVWIAAVIAMLVLLVWRSHKQSQIEHQYQLVLRSVAKAHDLGIDEPVVAEIEEFLGSDNKEFDVLWDLNATLRAAIDEALDKKCENRTSVHMDELGDRSW